MLEVSGLGRTRLTSVQQLSRGLQHEEQARRMDDGLSKLWKELQNQIRIREQVRDTAKTGRTRTDEGLVLEGLLPSL